MNLSVIIPSKNASNLLPCIEAVRRCNPQARIIVVDDGINWATTVPSYSHFHSINIHIDGIKPFIFSRNVNIGICAAGTDDIVILGDDGLLESPGGFSLLQREAELHPEIGIIGCTTNVTGARCQHRQGKGLRVVEGFAFVAVLIPRRTIDAVGLLDERFNAYGFEDNDYIKRVQLAGLQAAVHDGCYVDHGSLQSTFRPGNGAGDIGRAREIFCEKWGAGAA